MKINDSMLRKLKESGKYKELFKSDSLETVFSFVFSIIISLLLYFLISQSNIDDINTLLRSLSKDFAIALVGLLGFLITGLALLTSSVSSKVYNYIDTERGRKKNIDNIFISFYFIGLLIAIVILALITLYIITFFNKPINIWLTFLIIFIFSYLFSFIILYCAGLIGNCISLFNIINRYSLMLSSTEKDSNILKLEDKIKWNELKIMTLETIFIKYNNKTDTITNPIALFKDILKKYIEDSCQNEQKEKLLNYFNKLYENL